jgi:hypothetical protein
MIREKTVTSWPQLLEELYADSWNDSIRRFRSPFVFRGLDNVAWPLHSSLIRLGGEYESLERHLLRNFRKYAHRDVVAPESFWYWLAVAQHHGLPTRLLDWTFSPFVAAHFATADTTMMGEPGAIWCVNLSEVHARLPKTLKTVLDEEGAVAFTVDMLSTLEPPEAMLPGARAAVARKRSRAKPISSLRDFDRLTRDPFMLFFEPPSIDDRIVNQYALFSVLSSANMTVDTWLEQSELTFRRIVIPTDLKREVRDKLDQANINERVLFPGLDGLGRWLRRHYSPSTVLHLPPRTRRGAEDV